MSGVLIPLLFGLSGFSLCHSVGVVAQFVDLIGLVGRFQCILWIKQEQQRQQKENGSKLPPLSDKAFLAHLAAPVVVVGNNYSSSR